MAVYFFKNIKLQVAQGKIAPLKSESVLVQILRCLPRKKKDGGPKLIKQLILRKPWLTKFV